ncbi:hypothetical protein GCM10017784_12980 [Deinococcus indicus]|nr:hypothetical protein GCM10017784_12980 [Deinococcus indicus]
MHDRPPVGRVERGGHRWGAAREKKKQVRLDQETGRLVRIGRAGSSLANPAVHPHSTAAQACWAGTFRLAGTCIEMARKDPISVEEVIMNPSFVTGGQAPGPCPGVTGVRVLD